MSGNALSFPLLARNLISFLASGGEVEGYKDESFSVTLKDVLLFSTRVSTNPPIGFIPTPKI